MSTQPAPRWLCDERDRYVSEHHLRHLLPELYDWGYRGQYSRAREGLVHHLLGYVGPCGLRASAPEIATCVGAKDHARVLDANKRYRQRAMETTP